MISADPATFFQKFSSFWARLGELFWLFQRIQLLFLRFFRLFSLVRGADLVISADSATFFEIFPAVSLWLGS